MLLWTPAVLALALAIQVCYGDRKFFLGRRRGGMMPPPPPESFDADTVKTDYFDQPLDHFNTSVKDTWKQRYQVNDAKFKTGGPIFVLLGGEGAISASWLTSGQMYNNAVKYNALMFQPEHRFYGQSHPTSDVSTKNLHYLSSAQALADFEAFIQGMKQKYNIPDAKVVVFGGSYSGNLAAWYRETYPDTCVGAIASSAPVLAEEDFIEYIETVGNAQKYYNPGCYDAVNDAFVNIQDLVNNKDSKTLKSLFGICGKDLNYTDSYDIQAFYAGLIDPWMGATQYNSYGNSSTVAQYCHTMTETSLGDPIHRYSKWFHNDAKQQCVDHDYESGVKQLQQQSWSSFPVALGERQWIWQTCTEFAYYQTTDSQNQPFGVGTVGIKYMEDTLCTEVFGITQQDIAKAVSDTDKHYGGRTPNVTNVFFLNGSIDPWHTLSIFEHDLSASCPSRFIEGTSHCYDMYDPRPNDPPELTQARNDVTTTIGQWLSA